MSQYLADVGTGRLRIWLQDNSLLSWKLLRHTLTFTFGLTLLKSESCQALHMAAVVYSEEMSGNQYIAHITDKQTEVFLFLLFLDQELQLDMADD